MVTKSVGTKTLGVAVVALALLAMPGCGGSGATAGPEIPQQVQGQVVEVIGRSIIEVETLRLRDADGRMWTFTTKGPVGFTPSHLREHQVLGQPVIVSYVAKGDVLVAVEVTD